LKLGTSYETAPDSVNLYKGIPVSSPVTPLAMGAFIKPHQASIRVRARAQTQALHHESLNLLLDVRGRTRILSCYSKFSNVLHTNVRPIELKLGSRRCQSTPSSGSVPVLPQCGAYMNVAYVLKYGPTRVSRLVLLSRSSEATVLSREVTDDQTNEAGGTQLVTNPRASGKAQSGEVKRN